MYSVLLHWRVVTLLLRQPSHLSTFAAAAAGRVHSQRHRSSSCRAIQTTLIPAVVKDCTLAAATITRLARKPCSAETSTPCRSVDESINVVVHFAYRVDAASFDDENNQFHRPLKRWHLSYCPAMKLPSTVTLSGA